MGKLYKQLGLVATKIHRVLEFKQEAWLKSYIEFNTNKRKAATSNFEKDFFKLLSNSVYWKSIESLRKRVNIEIVNSEKRLKKVLSKPTLKNFTIINENLVMVQLARKKFLQNKPLYTDETNSVPPEEFVGLRAKMYSLYVPNIKKESKMTAKGIKKSYIKHHVRHSAFVNVLRDKKHSSPARFHTFKSTNHVINTVEIKKSCLSPFDTKRYILPDGISTLAYGHRRLRDL